MQPVDDKNPFIIFFDNRRKFFLELLVWLGGILLFGFCRVNIFSEPMSVMFPEFRNYSILGNITERQADIDGQIRAATGSWNPKSKNTPKPE